MKKQIAESLGSRLKKAATETEISMLLTEGEGFKYASNATRNKWKRLAEVRKKVLLTPAPAPAPKAVTPKVVTSQSKSVKPRK